MTAGVVVRNGRALARTDVPELGPVAFREWLVRSVRDKGRRVVSYFGETGGLSLVAVLADDANGRLVAARSACDGTAFASIVPEVAQAHLFEREIAEQFGVRFEGHPWMKPVRYHHATRPGHDAWGRAADAPILPGVTEFFRVEGAEVHEVAVGPVHAGVIEPGHFRFQCHGEQVFHLEIALGYQHRGVERALLGGPTKRTLPVMETVAGDTTVGHALAYAHAVEALSGTRIPARAHAIRGIALELERLANHVGDLGALAGDVAYLPTASYCGRLRGDFLNLTAEICGSRFGRGLVRPGGVGFDLLPAQVESLRSRIVAARRDVTEAVELLWETPSVRERFEGTGIVRPEDAGAVGLVGPAARACGLQQDVRHDFPAGIYRFVHLPVMTAHHGDVNSRAYVRWLEIQQSIAFILRQLDRLPAAAPGVAPGPLRPDAFVVSLIEGWRGEICHVAMTDAGGRFSRYKITDPSFHNWFGLALALRNGQISDFPLCNKSFNLSYCGHDL
ncbi:MAG TPA: NADH-quinone oxidoreductase subunit C [Thermoanaerobaculia bacterium]